MTAALLSTVAPTTRNKRTEKSYSSTQTIKIATGTDTKIALNTTINSTRIGDKITTKQTALIGNLTSTQLNSTKFSDTPPFNATIYINSTVVWQNNVTKAAVTTITFSNRTTTTHLKNSSLEGSKNGTTTDDYTDDNSTDLSRIFTSTNEITVEQTTSQLQISVDNPVWNDPYDILDSSATTWVLIGSSVVLTIFAGVAMGIKFIQLHRRQKYHRV